MGKLRESDRAVDDARYGAAARPNLTTRLRPYGLRVFRSRRGRLQSLPYLCLDASTSDDTCCSKRHVVMVLRIQRTSRYDQAGAAPTAESTTSPSSQHAGTGSEELGEFLQLASKREIR